MILIQQHKFSPLPTIVKVTPASPEMTETFLRGLKSQKERVLDQLLAIETLGDPKEMLHRSLNQVRRQFTKS